MQQKLRLMAVFPHPDDESLGMGGTLAKYAAEGVETYLICATRGERGWAGAEEDNPGLEALGRIREAELRCAAIQLRLHELCFLDYLDGDVDQADPLEIIAKLSMLIRRIQPHVLVTFSLDGIYGHPDHIALAQFTGAAIMRAADASFQDADRQPAFAVSKFYQLVDSVQTVNAVRETIGGLSMLVDGVLREHVGWENWAITTRIDTRPYFDQAWKAILCHQSQLPGFGNLVDLPRERLLEIWAEGCFVRIFSLVNGGRAVEYDLFEGLRE